MLLAVAARALLLPIDITLYSISSWPPATSFPFSPARLGQETVSQSLRQITGAIFVVLGRREDMVETVDRRLERLLMR